MTKILFSTVMRPFGIDSDDCTERVLPELHHGQVTFAQGIFSIRAFYGAFGLEYIAVNIKPETVVLNYPSNEEFIKELEQGYDYVGISYVMATHRKMEKMVDLVRKYAPNSKLILGGYGTTIPGADELADYVCREEGVTFMRRLLGEDLDAPRDHPIISQHKTILGYPSDAGSIVLAGLGCPNGCDFCTTSYFYDRKHIPLLKTGKDIWDVIVKIDEKLNTRSVGIMEEDFLLYKKRVLELAEITRKEIEKPVRIAAFASIKSIAMYDPVFLAEMGIETLWVGIESKSSQEIRLKNQSKTADFQGSDADISSYAKMDNLDIKTIIKGLHDVGINTLISMIVGLEHHTEETLQSDLEYQLSLNPTLSQFMIYTPNPGTPLHDCLSKEGRLLPDIPKHKVDGFNLVFKHPHFTPERLKSLQTSFFKKDYELLGPSLLRYIDKSLTGYLRFYQSDIPIQKARAKVYEEYCRAIMPVFEVAKKHSPNEHVAKWVADLQARITATFGKPSFGQRILGKLAKIVARYGQKLVDENRWVIQPKLQRIVYPAK
jgi:radical SAM superfamily enzyme YgiQ (UPF0313 family)